MTKNFIKPDRNYIDFLKELRNWICSKDNNKDQLRFIIKKYNINERTVLHRVIFYLYNDPHIIWYFNKYMNNLYNQIDVVDILYSLTQIMVYKKTNRSNFLTYVKSTENKDTKRIAILEQLKEIPKSEHSFYYDILYKNIKSQETDNPIEDIDSRKLSEHVEFMRSRQLPEKIVDFCKSIKESIPNKESCKSCNLFGRKSVILDTNINEPGEVDIAFVALNPGTDEPIFDKPLVGVSGRMFREHMYFLPIDTTWMITNIMLCSTAGQTDIGKTTKEVLQVATHCKDNLQHILGAFPAKIYVPIGGPAMEVFGLTGSIKNNSGETFESQGCKIIPIVHPSGAKRGGDLRVAYDKGWETIYKEAKLLKATPREPAKKKEKKDKIKNVSTEEEHSDTMSLLNIETLGNNKVLLVLIDTKDGSKHLIVKDIETSIFVKNDSWKECMMIDSPEIEIKINEYQRQQLLKSLNDSMTFSRKKLENVVLHK